MEDCSVTYLELGLLLLGGLLVLQGSEELLEERRALGLGRLSRSLLCGGLRDVVH